MSWAEIVDKARSGGEVTKFADVNILYLLTDEPKVPTVEFRMLPASLDLDELLSLATATDALVDHVVAGGG